MNDLREAYSMLKQLYSDLNMNFPKIKEIILGYRWNMIVDENDNISLAFKQGEEVENFESLKKYIGLKSDTFLEEIFMKGDTYRGIAAATLNVLSKPLNSKEELFKRGIERSEGLNFNYDVRGKKVGLVGFGVYIRFFLDLCDEFHAFDFRNSSEILSKRIGEDFKLYPEKIIWHLGENALNNVEVLKELDIIIMTGATIVNNSYLDILENCKKAQIKGIYGPSAEMIPDYFFDKGFNYIFSTSIREKDKYLSDSLAAWPNFSEFSHMDLYELKLK